MNLQQCDTFFFSIKSFISRDTAFYNPTVRADHPVGGGEYHIASQWLIRPGLGAKGCQF